VTTDGLTPQTSHIVVIAPSSFLTRPIVRERPDEERDAPGGPARPGDAALPLPRPVLAPHPLTLVHRRHTSERPLLHPYYTPIYSFATILLQF
jgi:hypothetical protein